MPRQKNRKPQNYSRKKSSLMGFFTVILCVMLGFEAVTAIAGAIVIHSLLKDEPSLDVDELYSQESTRIYDADNVQICDIGNTIRENITYDELPESLIDAFVAVEDSRFFAHDGFDLSRFAAAAVANLRSGSTAQGGSTFTMQLVKLTYFYDENENATHDRDIEYKVQQIDLARKLEKQSTKKEIFQLYLNKMNFGGSGNIRGVEKASEYYFNKTVSQLNLPESALLAGIINSPYYYDPYNYLDYSTARRNTVLDMMLRHGYITQDEYDLAVSVKVEDLLYDHSQDDTGADVDPNQAYIDEVLLEAQEITGQDPYTIAMDIHTAMNSSLQNLSYQICAGQISNVVYPADQFQVGFVTENNQTGEIVAIGGGRNYAQSGSSLLNHGTRVYHDPGSSVKPFLSYGLAFDNLGWATSHVVCDEPVGDSTWVYSNATGRYDGDVTLEYAIQLSLNTPAIAAFQDVIDKIGKDQVIAYMDKLNFSQLDDSTFNLGWAIGANGFTASAAEIAGAHSMLMNSGEYIKPHCIRTITFRSGRQDPITVSELDDYQPVACLSDGAAWLSAYMMNRVIYSPYYNYTWELQRDYKTYVKTGTSDWGTSGLEYGIPEGSMKDHWLVCSTTEYTTACWSGFDKADPNVQSYISMDWANLNITGNICSDIIDNLYADHTPADYAQPDDVTQITHIKGVFPYVSTIEGMSDTYITTGYVKKENSTLAEPESADELDDISTFTAEMADDDNSISFTWSDYPDSSKLEVASHTKDISLKDANGNILASATGNRMFDYSWVYGAVEYKATISQNGTEITTISSSSSTSVQEVDGLEPETETEACGFYAYSSGLGSSPSQVCVTFTTPEAKYTLPIQGTYEAIREWLSENGLSLSRIIEEHTNGTDSVGTVTITLNGEDVTGQSLTRSQLAQAVVTIIED
jgi:penicillin-binding protein 1A